MSSSDVSDRPLRSDAERNRLRILAAASEVFAERGLDVSLDDIAHAAGVGVGTVYRRFPDKEALIDALFEDKIRDIERVALDALRIADPWQAFSTFLREVATLHAHDRGLKETLLSGDRGRERAQHARDTIQPVGQALLRRAQEAGVLRADLADTDMPLILFAVGFVAEKTHETAPEIWERMLQLVLDGLVVRRDAPTPLPGEGMDPAELAVALSRKRC